MSDDEKRNKKRVIIDNTSKVIIGILMTVITVLMGEQNYYNRAEYQDDKDFRKILLEVQSRQEIYENKMLYKVNGIDRNIQDINGTVNSTIPDIKRQLAEQGKLLKQVQQDVAIARNDSSEAKKISTEFNVRSKRYWKDHD